MTLATISTSHSPDNMRGAFMKKLIKPISVSFLIILGLAACSKSVDNRDAPPTPRSTAAVNEDVEVSYFHQTLYDNVFRAQQCKNCHVSGGSGSGAFADENVVTAYRETLLKFNANFDLSKITYDPNQPIDYTNKTNPDINSITVADNVFYNQLKNNAHFCWNNNCDSSAQEVADQMWNWVVLLLTKGSVVNTQPIKKTAKDILVEPQLNDPTAPVPISDSDLANGYFDDVYSIVADVNKGYCSRCHNNNTTENTPKRPFFAQTGPNFDINDPTAKASAFAAVVNAGLVNLTEPKKSKLVVRPWPEQHNCGSNCQGLSTDLLNAITAWSDKVKQGNPTFDSNLLPSKALKLADGQITSGGARYDDYVIAKYEFSEGATDSTATVAHDVSGVDPVLDLRLFGDAKWVAGYGVQFGPGGQARSISVSQSQKLHDLIVSRGEYSIEAWVIPANTTQQGTTMDSSVIASYSSGTSNRNFTMGQYMDQYTFHNRVGTTTSNQSVLESGANVVQTTLQHVVMTYTEAEGRKLYINGNPVMCETQVTVSGDFPDECATVDSTVMDNQAMTSWDPGYLLTVGSDTDGSNQWLGKIKFLAIHSKALTEREIRINTDASVGQKFNLLFNISSLATERSAEWTQTIGSKSYIWFEVAVFDDYSYLFSDPKYIDLDFNKSASRPQVDFYLKGMRIGINGKEASVGQAYIPLGKTTDGTASAGLHITSPDPVSLSRLQGAQFNVAPATGTVIPKDISDTEDQFFLTFESIGGVSEGIARKVVKIDLAPAYTNTNVKALIPGVRTFDEINATMSALTGISSEVVLNDTAATATLPPLPGYKTLKAQLPDKETVTSFSSAQQTAIASLAGRYCDARVEMTAGGKTPEQYFGVSGVSGFSFASSPTSALTSGPGGTVDLIASAIVNNMVTTVGTLVDPATAVVENINGQNYLEPDTAQVSADPAAQVKNEVVSLADFLLGNTGHVCKTTVNNVTQDCSGAPRTRAIVKAMCTAVLSSAVVTHQ